MLFAFRILQGCGEAMMVPLGGSRWCGRSPNRTDSRHELRRHPRFDWTNAGTDGRWPDRRMPQLEAHFLRKYSDWSRRLVYGVTAPPDYCERTDPLDVAGLVLFGSGVGLLSYVLEVFGEHTLSARDVLGLLTISIILLAGCGFHAMRTTHPMLRLRFFRVARFGWQLRDPSWHCRPSTFSFRFCYQVGLGLTPIQSGQEERFSQRYCGLDVNMDESSANA